MHRMNAGASFVGTASRQTRECFALLLALEDVWILFNCIGQAHTRSAAFDYNILIPNVWSRKVPKMLNQAWTSLYGEESWSKQNLPFESNVCCHCGEHEEWQIEGAWSLSEDAWVKSKASGFACKYCQALKSSGFGSMLIATHDSFAPTASMHLQLWGYELICRVREDPCFLRKHSRMEPFID